MWNDMQPLRFKRVEPPAYVDRCYVADCYKTLSAARIAAEMHRIKQSAATDV